MPVYRNLVAGIAVLMIVLGLGIVGETAARGGGVGLILGALFVALGAGRLWMLRRRAG